MQARSNEQRDYYVILFFFCVLERHFNFLYQSGLQKPLCVCWARRLSKFISNCLLNWALLNNFAFFLILKNKINTTFSRSERWKVISRAFFNKSKVSSPLFFVILLKRRRFIYEGRVYFSSSEIESSSIGRYFFV